MLPERLARLQVLLGGVQVPLLSQHIREPRMQVAGRRQDRAGAFLRLRQGALVETAGRRGLATGHPHARQRHGGTERVGHAAGEVHASHGLRERLDGGLEVAGRPRREPEEPGPSGAREMVVRAGQLERPAGMLGRAVGVATGLSG